MRVAARSRCRSPKSASRFDGTGGPYLYTRAAFGRFAAFEVGWMLWFTRVASWAAVINVLVAVARLLLAGVSRGGPRAALITAIIAALAAINIRGIRQSSLVVNAAHDRQAAAARDLHRRRPVRRSIPRGSAGGRAPTLADLSTSGLLLIYAFGGYEVVPVPAGEARDPRREFRLR